MVIRLKLSKNSHCKCYCFIQILVLFPNSIDPVFKYINGLSINANNRFNIKLLTSIYVHYKCATQLTP